MLSVVMHRLVWRLKHTLMCTLPALLAACFTAHTALRPTCLSHDADSHANPDAVALAQEQSTARALVDCPYSGCVESKTLMCRYHSAEFCREVSMQNTSQAPPTYCPLRLGISTRHLHKWPQATLQDGDIADPQAVAYPAASDARSSSPAARSASQRARPAASAPAPAGSEGTCASTTCPSSAPSAATSARAASAGAAAPAGVHHLHEACRAQKLLGM